MAKGIEMTRKLVALLLAGAIVVGTGVCVAQSEHGLPAPKVSVTADHQAVSFELFRGNRIVIPAVINGHHESVMLDTGASISVVDREFARSIGMPAGQSVPGHGAGGTVQAEIVPGNVIDVGGMHLSEVTMGVMDLKPTASSIGRPINVVLGRDFFNSAVISIDWGRRQLQVHSHDSFVPDAGANALELTKRGPFNLINVSIAGAAPVEALFDLGNGGALAMPVTYWKDRPEVANLKYAAAVMGGVGGIHPARAVTVPQVTLAGKTFTNVPASLSESGNNDDPTQMTNVGIGLLKQFKVDLDLGRNRVYLTARTDAPPFDRDRAGVRFDLVGGRLKTIFVSPQGPAAAAGLKVGDEIIAINGRHVADSYYAGADWARGPAGKSVVLDRADGSKVTITLADYF